MSGSVREQLTSFATSWPGVSSQPHRFGGMRFVWNGREIGHLHGDHLLDIQLPKDIRDEWIASGRAKPHHIIPDSNWVSIYLRSEDDILTAQEALKIKYSYLSTTK